MGVTITVLYFPTVSIVATVIVLAPFSTGSWQVAISRNLVNCALYVFALNSM